MITDMYKPAQLPRPKIVSEINPQNHRDARVVTAESVFTKKIKNKMIEIRRSVPRDNGDCSAFPVPGPKHILKGPIVLATQQHSPWR